MIACTSALSDSSSSITSTSSVSYERTSESLEYYGRYLIEEELDGFSALIRGNPIDYDYQYKYYIKDDTTTRINLSTVEYGVLWKAEMEAQYEKLYSLLYNYITNNQIEDTRLRELSDSQAAFLNYIKSDSIFAKNTLGMRGELSLMTTAYGAIMIDINYTMEYRKRTIDLMEYLYMLDPSTVKFTYQSRYTG